MLANIFTAAPGAETAQMRIALMLALAVFSHLVRSKWKMEDWFIRLPAPVQAFGYAIATIVIFLFFTEEQRFIYFQF